MFKKILIGVSTLIVLFSIFNQRISAQGDLENKFYIAKVLEVVREGTKNVGDDNQYYQVVKAEIVNEDKKGEIVEVEHGGKFYLREQQKVKVGDQVVVALVKTPNGDVYFLTDRYRLPAVAAIGAIFIGLIIFFGRLKGFTSILGLGLSIVILTYFIVPQIIAGKNPLLISTIGAFSIAVISLYLAHGFSKRTSVALASTLITLSLATGLSVLFVSLASLFGSGAEEAVFLQVSGLEQIDLRGLLLGGIVIGVLGVLDDITTAQSAAVDELHQANPKLSQIELYKRGISIGREHISSLVNTLVLAYAGASFPLFLLFSMNHGQPFWVLFNSEFIVEEIIRTLVGSTALIFAVPITTYLAAVIFSKTKAK